MNGERLYEYYIKKDYNCAESILRAANDEYMLGLDENALKLLSGFGGGMGCGKSCGALCSAIAVISSLTVGERAHATEGFRDECAAYCEEFEEKLGSTDCSDLKERYMEEERRCFKTVESAYLLMEDFLRARGKTPPQADGRSV